MAEMPVTLAIPFYNAEAYLADAIRSVFAQTHANWELLLIDDGSTDNSLAIARAVRDPRVRVISDGRNLKLASRLNQVTELASHDLIARMDADDLMSPERLAVLADILQANPDIDLVSSGLYSVCNDLRLVGKRGADCRDFSFDDLLYKRKPFVHAALMARKSWYRRNAYNPGLPPIEDAELWLRAAKAGDFNALSIAQPLYVYREESNIVPSKLLRAYYLERHHLAQLIEKRLTRGRYKLRSLIKTAVSHVLAATGTLTWLQRLRNSGVPSAADAAVYHSLLARIAGTSVPGLSDAEPAAPAQTQ
jgi:glycosyltransferase involved in cell wall biosynthesis